MKSPFPGMDPYLEGGLWRDLHASLAVELRNQLSALVGPRYSVRLEPRMVTSDPGEEIEITYPDVFIWGATDEERSARTAVSTVVAPVVVPIAIPQSRAYALKIRIAGDRTLVTSIELISPANKSGNGFEQLQRKWAGAHRAGVHFVFIDLIRRGRRLFANPAIQQASYVVGVVRSDREELAAWPITVRDTLPTVAIPLLPEDPDVTVDLQLAFERSWELGQYWKDIDYSSAPPPPTLTPEDADWAKSLIAAKPT